MKLVELNEIDLVIIKIAEEINSQYFEGFEQTVGLFQSGYSEHIKIGDTLIAKAFFVSKDEFSIQLIKYPKISELKGKFKGNIEQIIWLGKHIENEEEIELRGELAHELKHAEQWFSNPVAFDKSKLIKLLSDILPNETICSTIENDANIFGNIVVSFMYQDYDWIYETNGSFHEYKSKLKWISDQINGGEKFLVFDGCNGRCVVPLEDRDIKYFKYYSQKVGI